MKKLICAVFFVLPLSGHTAFLGDLGSVPPTVSDNRNTLTRGAYDDYYTFSAASDSSDVTISFSLEPSSSGFFQAGALSVQLFEGVSSPVGTPTASAVSSGGQASVSFLANLMSNTTYTLRTAFNFNTGTGITANATTRVEADDSGESDDANDISPVPVPAAAWLFGTALIGLVGIKRRK